MSEMKIHEAECNYRPTQCPDPRCRDIIPFLEVLSHFDEKHPSDPNHFEKFDHTPAVQRISFSGRYFSGMCEINIFF